MGACYRARVVIGTQTHRCVGYHRRSGAWRQQEAAGSHPTHERNIRSIPARHDSLLTAVCDDRQYSDAKTGVRAKTGTSYTPTGSRARARNTRPGMRESGRTDAHNSQHRGAGRPGQEERDYGRPAPRAPHCTRNLRLSADASIDRRRCSFTAITVRQWFHSCVVLWVSLGCIMTPSRTYTAETSSRTPWFPLGSCSTHVMY